MSIATCVHRISCRIARALATRKRRRRANKESAFRSRLTRRAHDCQIVHRAHFRRINHEDAR